MTDMKVLKIPLARIQLPEGWRLRADGEDAILRESITKHGGILQPLVVRQSAAGFKLLAGFRRYKEAKSLGWETVQAVIYPKGELTPFEEFQVWADANLKGARNPMDKAEILWHGKELYELEHEETRLGSTGGSPSEEGRPRTKAELAENGKPAERYTKVMAEKLPVGESTVKNLIRLARHLPEEHKERLSQGVLNVSQALKLLPPVREKGPKGSPHADSLGQKRILAAVASLDKLLSTTARVGSKCQRRLLALVAKINQVLGEPVEELPVLTEDGAVKLLKSSEGR